ncbi:MAG: hypothetical protein KZQ81_17240 [Candidatus Thiodiazotropha sp. (ex Rostrolucina anterorostrata)]|nr:hypothetical protein [Candidatus Thiodiazotropha sp. (ex Rostrolucina anterorostrata)]
MRALAAQDTQAQVRSTPYGAIATRPFNIALIMRRSGHWAGHAGRRLALCDQTNAHNPALCSLAADSPLEGVGGDLAQRQEGGFCLAGAEHPNSATRAIAGVDRLGPPPSNGSSGPTVHHHASPARRLPGWWRSAYRKTLRAP